MFTPALANKYIDGAAEQGIEVLCVREERWFKQAF
jgi:hypothetical protein